MQMKRAFTGAVGIVGALALVGCGGGAEDPGKYDESTPPPEEVPMMTLDQGDDAAATPAEGAAPPPGGMAPPSDEGLSKQLKSFAKDDGGKELPVVVAMQNVADAYLRLQPTSAVEENQVEWPRLTNLNLLVRVGLIRAIPPAPAGKEWHIDDKFKVSLIDAQ